MPTTNELFEKYRLNPKIITEYIAATYDPRVMEHLSFEAVRDSLSDGQMASKLWVVSILSQFLGVRDKRIAIFGGWVGILGRLLHEFLGPRSVDNIEIDETLSRVNNLVMGRFASDSKFIHCDMYNFDYASVQYDVYVNTSAEHIECLKDWIEKIPKGKIVIVQSNDFFSHPQHINCVNNVTELEEQALSASNVKDVVYRGTLELPIYNRFMIVALT